MSKKLYEETNIQDIANAIRAKNGTQNQYTVAQMGNAVRAIETQPDLETLNVTENGNYLPSAGKDGFSSVSVNVSGGEAVVQPLSVAQNGTYNPPSGVDGYAPVTVDVSEGGVLPSEYQRVLYVQNNNAYINTGIAPDSNTTVYLQAVLSRSAMMMFGSRNERNDGAFDLLFQPTASSNQRFRVDYGNTESGISQPSDMSFSDIVFGASGISVNGNTPASALTFSGNQYPISLFALNDAGSTTVAGSMKCFSFKIVSGETIVRDFIPCRKKIDNEVGFYDLITSTFYGKSGSGTLIDGPAVVDVSQGGAPDVETNGLVVYFDGLNNTGTGHDSSSSIWKDLSGNNNDGNVINGVWGSDALLFNGSSSFVTIGQLNPNTVTLEAFVRFYRTNSFLWGPSIASNLEGGGYGITLHNGKIACTVNISGEYKINEISQPITDIYFLIAMTFDGMTLNLYVNGELVNSISASGNIQSPTLDTILALGTNPTGASSGASETFFDGKIRTFRMYNRALSATEIKNNYQHDALTY